ncbi:MAG: transcriptional regulator [Chamaesiphon sp.]|nr:transcriptional regulator [Chamaesiphon sp.]
MIHTINRNTYGDLLAQHQPKAIKTDAENEAAILLAESLEHRQRTPEEDTLLELLIILIEKFEETSYPLPNLKSDLMLLHLMEARNMKQEELVGVIGSRGVVSEIVNGKRSISKAQAKVLGELFHVSPSLFI